jgi:toxin HigB-1
MQFRIADKTLERMDTDGEFDGGYSENIAKAFRKRMQAIRAATDENDLRELRSLHFEKLKGKRKGQYSIRLNDQFRLILEIEKEGRSNRIVVCGIEDYH